MSVWSFVGFLVGFLLVLVNSRVDIDAALRLAHCRVTCINKMNLTKRSDSDCRVSYDCSQCWEICRALQKSQSVCEQTTCVGSCQESCHWFSADLSPPMLLNQPLEQLCFKGTTVSWPLLNNTTSNTVYVVMVDHQQYLQTLDHMAKLPLKTDSLTVQVLVVDGRGFTEVFIPRPQSPIDFARIVISHLGLEPVMGLNDDVNRTSVYNSSLSVGSDKHTWRLREVSKTYHRDFARVHISWKGQQSTPPPMYLVTWQVESGLLRGNLLTNTSRVTLSIGANMLFRIQVSLFTLDYSQRTSEFLIVDTHRPSRGRYPYLHTYLIHPMGVTGDAFWDLLVAALAAVVLLLFTFTWRYQQRWSQLHIK